MKSLAPPSADINQLVTLFQTGDFVEMERKARLLVECHPGSGIAWKALGLSLQMQGKDALSALQKATELLTDAAAHNSLGNALLGIGQLDGAIANFRRALEIKPDFAEAHNNLGNVLQDIGRLDDAVASYSRALEINPGFAEAYNNLGNVLQDLGQLDDAIASYRQALEIKPDYIKAHNNLGIALQELGQLDSAVASYRQALQIKPDFADAHHHLAMALLKQGNMKSGWEEYEWRLAIPLNIKIRRNFKQPQWRGEVAEGQTLLIHSEQGFGDTLQFCRYASLASASGLRVILEVQQPLVRLLRSLSGVDLVVGTDEKLPAFDLHCPMLSMPLAFRTTLATIPRASSYLQADQAQIDVWRTRLAALPNKGLRIGLVWAGNPRSHLPQAAAVDRRRSVAPERLAPLFELPGLHFFSLQKGGVIPENFPPTNFMDEMHDFADTAAFIANLDLVISVDTAVVHLAAALGKPVWMLDRFDSCWRWLDGRQDSPWYPSLRLFRQPTPGDWQAVIKRVVEELCLFSEK